MPINPKALARRREHAAEEDRARRQQLEVSRPDDDADTIAKVLAMCQEMRVDATMTNLTTAAGLSVMPTNSANIVVKLVGANYLFPGLISYLTANGIFSETLLHVISYAFEHYLLPLIKIIGFIAFVKNIEKIIAFLNSGINFFITKYNPIIEKASDPGYLASDLKGVSMSLKHHLNELKKCRVERTI